MKTDKADLEIVSTITGDEVKMTVDENALVHIMSVLTDLYSDPELAVIREYSTNALDAHIEAGQVRPIEVVTPTGLSPFLTIKDYGIGLSADDIHNIYSKYGASTKRDTNEQVGVLGLGCKAALTYTQQFTLVGIKDGVRTSVSVSRNEDGAGSLTIVEQVKTDEQPGVTITIPAKRYNDIARKAERFFQFWEPGTVLLNGKQPKRFDGFEIGPGLYAVERERDTIVMGNVPYPTEFDAGLNHRYGLVAYVDIGAVNFVPSREELQDTKKTKDAIAQVEQRTRQSIFQAIQDKINDADTPSEGLSAAVSTMKILPNPQIGNFEWNGQEIPAQLDLQGNFWVPRSSYKLSEGKRVTKVSIFDVPTAVWFYNYEADSFTAPKKKKLLKWLEDSGLEEDNVDHFALCNNQFSCDWISPERWVDFKEVEKIKLPRKPSYRFPNGRPIGAYDAFVNSTHTTTIQAAEITTSNILWDKGNAWDTHDKASCLKKLGDDWTLVPLPSNRVDKFLRTFPQAQQVDTYLQKCYDTWIGKLSMPDRLALHVQLLLGQSCRTLKKMDESKVKDPELRKYIAASHRDISAVKDILHAYQHALRVSFNFPGNFTDPLENYPLLADVYNDHFTSTDHGYLYINLLYEHRKKES